MLLTGPSSQTIAATAARDATIPRTTSTHWFSSSGLEKTLASRLGSITMCRIRKRNAQAPTFHAIKRRVASRISTPSCNGTYAAIIKAAPARRRGRCANVPRKPTGALAVGLPAVGGGGALGVPAALSALGGGGDLGMRRPFGF